MNQVAKIAQPSSASSLSGPRPVPGGRFKTPANETTPLEEISPQPGVSYNDAALAYEEEGRGFGRRRNPQSQTVAGGFEAPSQSFAAMFESQGTGDGTGGATGSGSTPFGGLLSRAIAIYETNARVIGGGAKTLGTSLSISL